MDYDDNDFQSQNLYLAGEGSNKFPPVIRPYALPKFDFDDSLHGSLRFDSLVETEVFLGIESNEDSQWIEDYSRGSSGLQFSTSAAESCAISTRNNVWSEATSSESVEMLLKSVGQEDIVPEKTNTKGTDACDELGCIIKQMEPSLKQDSNISAITNLQSTLLPGEFPENFSALKDDGCGQQTQAENSSQTHTNDMSVDRSSGDLAAVNVEARLPISEGNMFVDDKCDDVNERDINTDIHESSDSRTETGSGSGAQFNSAVANIQNITTGDDVLNDEDGSYHVNKTADENLEVLGGDKGELQEEKGASIQGTQRHTQVLSAKMVEIGGSQMDNPVCMSSLESTIEKADTIEPNLSTVEESSLILEGNPGLEVHDKSEVDAHEDSLVVVEGNTDVERHEVEHSSLEDITSKTEVSLLSTKDIKASQDEVDGICSGYVPIGSSLSEVHNSVELVSEVHAECHISSSILVGSMQTCEKYAAPRQVDVDQDVPVHRKESLESSSDGDSIDRVCDKDVGTSSFGEVATGKDLTVSQSEMDSIVVSESDGVLVPSWNDSDKDAVEDKHAKSSPLPEAFTPSDKMEDVGIQISAEASLADNKEASQVITCVQSVSAVDTCNKESQMEPQAVAIRKAGEECTKDKEVGSAVCSSPANEGAMTEATVKENDKKKPMNATEPAKTIEMRGVEPSAMQDPFQVTAGIGQEEAAVTVGANFDQITVPRTIVEQGSCINLDEPASSTLTAIRTVQLSGDEGDKEQFKRSSDPSVSVSLTDGDAIRVESSTKDPNQNDVSKDDSSFTFEVSPLADLTHKDGKKWQTLSTVEVSQATPILDGSTAKSGLGQPDTKIPQHLSRGSPKISNVATSRSGSKGNSERKPRRASGKAAVKETVKKGKSIKETTSMSLDKGDKTSNVSVSPSGVSQLLQSTDMQRYGRIDSSSVKPFVLATSTSGLPDLNSSVSQATIYQQPFTDLQQVQLRAQIFVYGALIQGMAPDEAYMISAFGHDGGKGIWENAWRSCLERFRGQNSHLVASETPMQPRAGARAPEQLIKQSAIQSKVVSSPIARGSSKGTPPIVNPILPFSSPLWSMPTPPGDSLQSSNMPRGPLMDYQRALSPLHPHQTPAIRNFMGHNPSWLSQASFGGPWVASPTTSAVNNGGRFSGPLAVTESIQLTPGKESSVSHPSGATPTPVAQGTVSTTVSPGPSVLDVKRDSAATYQSSTDLKPKKRKKTSANENLVQNSLPLQPQIEPVTATIANSASASAVVTTPVSLVPKAPNEKFVKPTTPSCTNLMKGDLNSELRTVLSEESTGDIKDARFQAEVAAVQAASALSHSQVVWDQLDKQRNSGLLPDVESQLASAAVSVTAAAAVAKAAAAAAKVASNAALQAKLMAEEALASVGQSTHCQSNVIAFPDGMKNVGNATTASILKGDFVTNSSSSILVAAREAARKRVEAASAASKRAENMDAIVKAAELAAEAVAQVGKIVAMGDPSSFSKLVAAGPEGYWKQAEGASGLVSKPRNVGGQDGDVDCRECPDTMVRQLKEVQTDKKESHVNNTSQEKPPIPRAMSNEDHDRLEEGISGSSATSTKYKDQEGKVSDLAKTVNLAAEPGNGSRSSIVQNVNEKEEASKENSIKADSIVEVFKDGNGFKAAWFSAKVLNLDNGKAHVNYTHLTSDEGSEKLQEWVPLEGEGDKAPKLRIAHPITVMPFEGTRKRRRAAMGEHTWSVGDRVDAWIQDSWWEGVVTEKCKKDVFLSVNFPAHRETSLVSKWNLRPSLIWKDGNWIEWTSSGGDTPKEKRPRVRSPAVEVKGKDKASTTTCTTATESDKSDDPTILALTTDEKLFNIGKSTGDGNKTDALRMTRTGLQKERSRVIFGVPKPGKKRKFMEVSKHYVADQSGQLNEANDSVKISKYLMPQGPGSRGWKSTTKTELSEKRAAISKTTVLKSGKPQNISGRTIAKKENLTNTSILNPDDVTLNDHVAKTKDFVKQIENASGQQNSTGIQSLSKSEAAEDPLIFSAQALPSDNAASKKMASKVKPERASKGKLAPAGSKFGKDEEDKALIGNSTRFASDSIEPRRSNRRIQPTSRLLEGLQSSLMVSKIPSVSHEKSHKSRTTASRGPNHG